MDRFSTNLIFLRTKKGLTQAEMKDLVGVERTSWNNYEKNKSKPNLEQFCRIVEYFDVLADDLLFKDITIDEVQFVKRELKPKQNTPKDDDFDKIREQQRTITNLNDLLEERKARINKLEAEIAGIKKAPLVGAIV